jgi:hypothetical protein
MAFLPENSRFAVQNDGPYLPRITRETCTVKPWDNDNPWDPKIGAVVDRWSCSEVIYVIKVINGTSKWW